MSKFAYFSIIFDGMSPINSTSVRQYLSLFFLSWALFFTNSIKGQSATIIDTSPSKRPYGVCKEVDEIHIRTSHWCNKGELNGKPSNNLLKYGRQTLFHNPSKDHKSWCGWRLESKNGTVGVALSTKYIRMQRDISPNSPYCGRCLCARIVGTDNTSNPNAPKEASRYFGRAFRGRVVDSCPECSDDHIDVLAHFPYVSKNNENKTLGKTKHPNIPINMAYTVGIWLVEWQFVSDCRVDCQSYFDKNMKK